MTAVGPERSSPSPWVSTLGDESAPPRTAAQARAHVRALLTAHERATGVLVAARAHADALLVISELVTNALRHGGGMTAFSARVTDDALLEVVVTDGSPNRPAISAQAALLTGGGGLGWPLIRRLATRVTLTATAQGGKDIRVLLPLE
ncbi:ATP-binding protein [Streptantibioticus parmotrematis]|uniref:ATP-binding protein n=1 Tax=Streptantibioticus parmotrematis TaxID=2873249 RepID=UPI0033CF9E73